MNIKNMVILGWGDIAVEKSPIKIKTELGSCVAVIFYDKKKKIGGMTHIIQPKSKGKCDTRFADVAVKELVRKMIFEKGCSRKNMVCSVIGGGNPTGVSTDICFFISCIFTFKKCLKYLELVSASTS